MMPPGTGAGPASVEEPDAATGADISGRAQYTVQACQRGAPRSLSLMRSTERRPASRASRSWGEARRLREYKE